MTKRKTAQQPDAAEVIRAALRAAQAEAEAKNKANWQRSAEEIAARVPNLPPIPYR